MASSDVTINTVKVHPLVVFSILNSYIRRDEWQKRVIGTLLGIIKEGSVEITDCYAVPHQEKSDEVYVAINKDYHKAMLGCHRRINSREQIVGWYSTSMPGDDTSVANATLIHDFYSNECLSPVHFVVDTSLSGDKLGFQAFTDVLNEVSSVSLELSATEIACMHQMISRQETAVGGAKWEQSMLMSPVVSDTMTAPTSSASLTLHKASLRAAVTQLIANIDTVLAYVNSVIEGKAQGTSAQQQVVGIALMEAVLTIQSTSPEDFKTILHGHTDDLMMLGYLSSLVQTQSMITQKLNSIM